MKLTAIMTSLFAVVLTVGAQAATSTASDMSQHEVLMDFTRATGANFQLGGTVSGSNLDAPKTFNVRAGYLYHVVPGIQVGIQNAGLTWNAGVNGGNSSTTWDFLVGATFNWPMASNLDNAFFLGVGAGLRKLVPDNKFQFGAEIGKRITIVEHVNYRPSISFLKVTDFTPVWSLNILAFSATF